MRCPPAATSRDSDDPTEVAQGAAGIWLHAPLEVAARYERSPAREGKRDSRSRKVALCHHCWSKVVHLRGRLSHPSPEVRRLLTMADTAGDGAGAALDADWAYSPAAQGD